MTAWTTRNIPDQSGKVAIITGATGGLGLETALGLVGAGADVILAGRNPAKGKNAETLIRRRYKNAKVRFELADMASLTSIKAFADRILTEGRPINMLINNAGIMAPHNRGITADGFELQLGTTYLSHFALTSRLLPALSVAKARVVQLSSFGHRSGTIQLDDLNYEQGYNPFPVYSQSKLAMLMFALELDRRSNAKGWGLTSVAAHPGFARTDLFANGPAPDANILFRTIIPVAKLLMGQSAAAGALPTLMAATMPGVKGGQYFGPQGFKEFKGPPGPGQMEAQALDAEIASKLWTESERLTGVTFC
jgi:NAD(P)-dependent dehydrogenase (short-subunit alcohol dehydrogenase family)